MSINRNIFPLNGVIVAIPTNFVFVLVKYVICISDGNGTTFPIPSRPVETSSRPVPCVPLDFIYQIFNVKKFLMWIFYMRKITKMPHILVKFSFVLVSLKFNFSKNCCIFDGIK